jgi:hypothetical protein
MSVLAYRLSEYFRSVLVALPTVALAAGVVLGVAATTPAVAAAFTTPVKSVVVSTNGNAARLFLSRPAVEQLHGNVAGAAVIGANGTTDLLYHGGPVMRNPVNYLIFWQPTGFASSFPAGFQAGIQRFFQDVGDTPYYNINSQYNDTSGVPVPNSASFGGAFTYTAAYPHAGTQADPLTDADIQAAVTAAIAANPGWVAPGINTMYFVFTAPTVHQCFNATNCFAQPDETNGKYCAYHSMFGSASAPRIYAFEPFDQDAGASCTGQSVFPNGQAIDVQLSTVSHEMVEANTDPGAGSGIVTDGWYDTDGLSGENGDKCAYNYGYVAPDGTNIVLNGNPYQLQQEWSNNPLRGCVKRYGDAPVTAVQGSLNFGTVPRGTSLVQSLPIQNAAGGDLNILSIRLGSGSSSAYSLVNVPPRTATIYSGETLTALVKLAPSASSSTTGPLTGTVVIDTDDPSTTTYNVALSGLVGIPKASLSGLLNFGTTCAGSPIDRQLIVTNTGSAPLTISSVAISGAATPGLSVLSPPVLPQTIAVGSSLTFTVRFTPPAGASGNVAGSVVVTSDDPDSPQSIPLTGTIGAPIVTLASGALDFGGVPTDNRTAPNSSDRSLTIGNTGTCALTLASTSFAGANAGDFSIVGAPSLPLAIAAGSSVTLTVRFNPAAPGSRSATLTVGTSDAVNPAKAVALTGLGLIPAILTSVNVLNFVPTVIQSQAPAYPGTVKNLTITNSGQAELIVDTMGTSGAPFSAPGATTPPARFAPSDGFDEAITFAPVTKAKFTGTFTVADTNAEGPVSKTVQLCGEGVMRGIRVLAVDANGTPFQQIQRLHLQSHGTAQGVNVNQKNLSLVSVTTSCDPTQKRQYENQSLPATDTVNQQSSYYNLDVTAGGKATSITFTLGVSEFKTLVVTVK